MISVPTELVQDEEHASCPSCETRNKQRWVPVFYLKIGDDDISLVQCVNCKALFHVKKLSLSVKNEIVTAKDNIILPES